MDYIDANFLSLCKAIEVLGGRADTICLPVKQVTSYDLIVDVKGTISRIRVIRTECKTKNGTYIINLRRGAKREDFSQDSCEFLFVDSPIGQYCIPSFEVTQKRATRLSLFKRYRIRQD